jgi:hypothetical protein
MYIKNCCLKKLGFMKKIYHTTAHKFMQIKIITPPYGYYKIALWEHRYEYFIMPIMHKTSLRCIKSCCLNKLFEFFIIFGRITTYNFVQINIITPNYYYYKIVQWKLWYEYSIKLTLNKIKVRCVKNCCSNESFGFMKIIGRITTHNSVQINIITPNYVCYKIFQLTLQNKYFIAQFFLKA